VLGWGTAWEHLQMLAAFLLSVSLLLLMQGLWLPFFFVMLMGLHIPTHIAISQPSHPQATLTFHT
jgi:hypothetical protein